MGVFAAGPEEGGLTPFDRVSLTCCSATFAAAVARSAAFAVASVPAIASWRAWTWAGSAGLNALSAALSLAAAASAALAASLAAPAAATAFEAASHWIPARSTCNFASPSRSIALWYFGFHAVVLMPGSSDAPRTG